MTLGAAAPPLASIWQPAGVCCGSQTSTAVLAVPALMPIPAAEFASPPLFFLIAITAKQHEAAALFLRHAQQLEEHFPDSLPLLRAQWLFALAARLEKPCTPDVAAGFRALLRHCCRLRAGLTNVADPLLPALNVLIVVAGAYFAQDEQLCSVVDAAELL